jgi:hypothetical protein
MSNLRRAEDDIFVEALEKWREQHPGELHWDNNVVIDWMIANEHFGIERRVVRRELLKKLTRAQNKRHVRNPQGKLVKAYHSAMLPVNVGGTVVQKQLWGDRLTMSASFAHASMQQRHKQTEGMCKSMHVNIEDVNENNPNLADNPIQLSFDFSYVTETKKRPRVEKIQADAPPVPPAPADVSSEKPKRKKRKPR